MMRRFLLCLWVVAVPAAGAHGGEQEYEQTLQVPGGTAFLSLQGPPFPMSKSPMTLWLGYTAYDNGTKATEAKVVFIAPDNSTSERPVNRLGEWFSGMAGFPTNGTWRVNVTYLPMNLSVEYVVPVRDPVTWIVSFPEDAPGAGLAPLNVSTSIGFDVMSWQAGFPAPRVDDATARVERWTDDHGTKLGERIERLDGRVGRLTWNTTLTEAGMYHVFVASPTLELEYDDLPYTHIYAVSLERYNEFLGIAPSVNEAPALSSLAIVAVLGGLAFAYARRR